MITVWRMVVASQRSAGVALIASKFVIPMHQSNLTKSLKIS